MAIAWAAPRITVLPSTAEERSSSSARRHPFSAVAVVLAVTATVLAGFGVAAVVDAVGKAAQTDAVTTGISLQIDEADRARRSYEQARADQQSSVAELERQLASRDGLAP